MKKITNFLFISALALGVTFTHSSCDSSPQSEDNILSVSSRGIDLVAVSANPNAIAEMPRILLPGEIISHSDDDQLALRGVSQLGTAAVINSAGGLDIDNISLQYGKSEVNPNTGLFRLASKNAFPDIDINIRSDFQARMDTLITASNGAEDSLQSALGVPIITNDTWRAVLRAARSIGILTALGPEPDPGSADTELPLVLINRVITYTVTSTNQDLLDTQTISGTYRIEDRWAIPQLFAVEDGTPTADEFDQVSLRLLPTQVLLTIDDDNESFAAFRTFSIQLKQL